MDKGTLIGVVGMALALLSFLFSHFKSKPVSELEKGLSECREHMKALASASDVEVLKKQMSLFWTIAEKGLGAVLHSPHRPELDDLIEKVDSKQRLSSDDLKKFDRLMTELIGSKPSQMTPGEEAAMVLYHAAVMSRHMACV